MYVGQGYASRGMFNFNISNENYSLVYIVNFLNLWHGGLRHMNYKSIKNKIKLGLLSKSPDEKLEKCGICIKSKITRKTFTK